jgi:hypothetical protein
MVERGSTSRRVGAGVRRTLAGVARDRPADRRRGATGFQQLGGATVNVLAGDAATDRRIVPGALSRVGVFHFPTAAGWRAVSTSVGASRSLTEWVSSAIQTGWPLAVAVSLRRAMRTDPEHRLET